MAFVLVALSVAPHLLPQQKLDAVGGLALWTSALVYKALLSISLATVVILYLPATELFTLLTHWCLHTVVPFLTSHLGLDGHRLGDAATIVPALVIGASVLSVGLGLWRGTRAVRRWLTRSALGSGPGSSVIVAGSEIVVAAAGLRAPRVVVSAGALVHLDDDELAAGLEHEWGHIRRHHRQISVLTEVCGALARFWPGTKGALMHLRFHLERDADDYAVRRTGNPLALASAICKAAQGEPHRYRTPAFAGLVGSGVPERLRRLAGAPAAGESHLASMTSRVLALVLAMGALSLLTAVPVLASVGFEQVDKASMDRAASCE